MSTTIGSSAYNNSIYSNYSNKPAQRMASAKRINSAGDDAAMAAMAEKLQALINGLDKGTDNSYDMQNLLKTAEGGMSAISDSLQRIRELSLKSQNGIYTDADKELIQHEVNQLLEHIDFTVSATQFNGKNLLDGGANNLHTASDAHGNGMNVSIGSVSSSSLGIAGLDITGAFDLSKIDKALEQLGSVRSLIGASVNRLDHTIDHTQRASVHQAEALSRIIDTDYAKESISYNTNRLLEQYRNFSLKSQLNSMGNQAHMLL